MLLQYNTLLLIGGVCMYSSSCVGRWHCWTTLNLYSSCGRAPVWSAEPLCLLDVTTNLSCDTEERNVTNRFLLLWQRYVCHRYILYYKHSPFEGSFGIGYSYVICLASINQILSNEKQIDIGLHINCATSSEGLSFLQFIYVGTETMTIILSICSLCPE